MQRTTVWSWFVGGLLLLAQSVLGVFAALAVATGDRVSVALTLGAALLTAAACAVYAWGLRPEESVVARRPAGMAVVLGLGALGFAQAVWWAGPTGYAGGASAAATAALGTVASFILASAASVAVLRVGVIPRPWSHIPLAATSLGLGLSIVFAVALPLLAPGSGSAVGVLPATIPGVVGLVSIVLSRTAQPTPAAGGSPLAAALRRG